MSKPIIYIDERDCHVSVIPDYLTSEEAEALHQEIVSLPLIQHQLRPLYGKEVFQPRLSICLNRPYAYSGRVHPAVEWSPLAKQYCDRLNREFDSDLNAGMVNYYRDGKDYISAHSDDESSLARNGGVFGLSTHGTRDMVMRWKDGSGKVKFPLPPGSLLKMLGRTQELMTHEMPKRAHAAERGSITYRRFQ